MAIVIQKHSDHELFQWRTFYNKINDTDPNMAICRTHGIVSRFYWNNHVREFSGSNNKKTINSDHAINIPVSTV